MDPHTVPPQQPEQPKQPLSEAYLVTEAEEKKLLLEWTAPSRPFKRRDKDFFTTVTTMAVLFIVILLFMKEFLVVLVVMAFVFLIYVLATVPPEPIQNTIYTTGLQNGVHFYSWSDLLFYGFDNKWEQPMLVARTRTKLPGAVYMLLGDISRERVEEVIGTRLPYQSGSENSWMDRTASWLSEKVPLDKTAQQ